MLFKLKCPYKSLKLHIFGELELLFFDKCEELVFKLVMSLEAIAQDPFEYVAENMIDAGNNYDWL